MRLGHGWDNWRATFTEQMTSLRSFVDAVLSKLGLPANDGPLPETLFLRHLTSAWNGQPYDVHSYDAGTLHPCSRTNISRGDVVDVRVIPEIVLVVGTDGLPRTCIFFGWDWVVKVRDRTCQLQVYRTLHKWLSLV